MKILFVMFLYVAACSEAYNAGLVSVFIALVLAGCVFMLEDITL